MPELGSRSPKFPEEDSWAILCPQSYCGANPHNPCMNAKGAFSRTHLARRDAFNRKQTEDKAGPKDWASRPQGDMEARSKFERKEFPEG